MPRPVKWSRDLQSIRDRTLRSKTETWARKDIEALFGVGPSSAHTITKAIGGVQAVGASHFIDRSSLLEFLEEMITAESVEAALQKRLLGADPVPQPRALQVSLPDDLRHAMLPDLPESVTLEPGRIEIRADSVEAMVESLFTLAIIMQNDLDRWSQLIEPPRDQPAHIDEDLREFLSNLRQTLE